MKRKREELKRAVSIVLVAFLIVNMIDLSALTAYALKNRGEYSVVKNDEGGGDSSR